MTFCQLLTQLAWAVVLLLALPWLLDLLIERIGERLQRFCDQLCRLWIVLAFLTGLVLGVLLFHCHAELADWLLYGAGQQCRRLILLGFLLLLAALWHYLKWVARCGTGIFGDGPLGFLLRWLPLLLALLLLAIVLYCCGDDPADPGITFCQSLLRLFLLLFVLAAALRYLAERICKSDSGPCRDQTLRWTWIVIVLLFLLAGLVWLCCDRLADRDYDLAMVGIWWEGGYQGEQGFHLRWGFRVAESESGRPPLPFPEDGFDLERRESAGGTWEIVNDERIFPALVWGDELAPPPGDMSVAEAVKRLHPDSWEQFADNPALEQTPFSDLVEMLSRDPYVPLYFVEEPEASEFLPGPANPYDNEADRDQYLEDYYDAGTEEEPMRPLAVWTLEPMATIQLAALFPEIARLVGLYYLDQEPDPDVEHDYRIVGYWADATRRYTVHELSRPNTEPLGPVVLTQAESPVEVGELPGAPPVTVIDDRAAGLVWTPPDEEPDVFFGPIDEIEAVVFRGEHKPLEGSGSPPVCPVATDATGFAPLQRPGDDGETPEERPPVAVSPVEDPDTGDLSWPRYYLFDRDLDYGCHAYRVLGQDVFGRPAPPSSPRVATVHDLTPPPPPTLVKADFYQRADTSLPASVREQYLPETDDNEFALVVSWVWTDEMAARVDDVESFQVHLHHTDHDSFVATQPWRDAATWEESLGAPVPFAPALPMPVRYTSLAVPVLGSYWEVVLTDDDVSAASIGLAAGDTEPVEYAWVGVSATDHAPYNNQGAVSVPVLTLGRDLTPPDPPDPPPALAGPVGPADDSGNSALRLEWPGNPLYTYQLHRVNVLDLGPIAPVAGGQLPACLGDEQPECDPGVDGDECLEEIEEFDIRATATQNPGAFLQASPLPLEVVAGQAGHGDSVDATVSSRWLYAAKAVDAAGNVSDLSCPSHVILVEDGVPPRAPVWTEAVGGDGHVVLTWAANPESDLDEYAVYRTAFSERTASRRRMVELARIRADGTRVGPGAGAVPGGSGAYGTLTWEDVDATPGTVWRYRLDAVDLTGNRSPLSGVATARSYDATPPAAPVWAAPALTAGPGPGGAPQVTLAWVPPPDDPELAILVQRRQQGTAAWRSQGAWLDAGTVAWVDQGVEAGVTYEYRLRAMDPSGNRSVGFSVVESVVVPE